MARAALTPTVRERHCVLECRRHGHVPHLAAWGGFLREHRLCGGFPENCRIHGGEGARGGNADVLRGPGFVQHEAGRSWTDHLAVHFSRGAEGSLSGTPVSMNSREVMSGEDRSGGNFLMPKTLGMTK